MTVSVLSLGGLLLLFLACVALSYLNLGSPIITQSLVTALFIGTATYFVSLLASLKTEEIQPREFIYISLYDRESGKAVPFFLLKPPAEFGQVTPPIEKGGFTAVLFDEMFINPTPQSKNESLLGFVTVEIAYRVARLFVNSWSVVPREENIGAGTITSAIAKNNVEAIEIQPKAFDKFVRASDNLKLPSEVGTWKPMKAPAETEIIDCTEHGSEMTSRCIKLANPYAIITIRITTLGVTESLGEIGYLFDIPYSQKELGLQSFRIELNAETTFIRSGHQDMKLYIEWIETMFKEIELDCNFNTYWEKVLDWYKLAKLKSLR